MSAKIIPLGSVSGRQNQRNSKGQFAKGSTNSITHGHSVGGKCTSEYYCWVNIKTRCTNPNTKNWKYYGGRGITLCKCWETFENFYEDMGPKPSAEHTIERKNNELGYCKENCCWVLKFKQAANKRNNHYIEFRGQIKHVAEWARELGIPESRLRMRLHNGWDCIKALTTPYRGPKNQ